MLNFYVQNDQCSNATNLGSLTDGQNITVTGQSNVVATDDVSETPSCFVNPTLGVWYKLTVSFPTRIEVSTCNQANFDTQIAVYSRACGSLSCEFGADNTAGCDVTTRVTVYAEPKDIYILVGGFSGNTGDFDLMVRAFTLRVSGGSRE